MMKRMSDAPATRPLSVHVRSYDQREYEEEVGELGPALRAVGRRKVTWICITAPADLELLDEIGTQLGIDPYELKAVVAYSKGRSRMEDFGTALFLTWSSSRKGRDGMEVHPAYFVLGADYLISFQDSEVHYEEIIERLRNERSRLRKSGPDYLLFVLLSEIAEEFFDRVEDLADSIDRLEDRLIADSSRGVLQEVRQMREQVNAMWKAVWPLRETADSLAERSIAVLKGSDHMYFKELFNTLEFLLHEVDTLNQVIPQLIDLYETSASNQLNQIVKVLTVFSVVFTPLTLIAGIYGMNFEHMPELDHVLGYPSALILMLSLSTVMLLYFYKKGWIFVDKKRA